MIFVIVQDVKKRAIHIVLPIIIFGIAIGQYMLSGKKIIILGYNFLFLGITFLGLYLYLKLKHKHGGPTLKESIGLGDILFFIAVIPFFYLQNYILYFSTGMLFSIVVFLIAHRSNRNEHVPLAGYLALYFIIIKGLCLCLNIDFFYSKLV